MTGCALHGDVRKFVSSERVTEQQASTTHVASPYEIGRKLQAFTEDSEENIDIFPGGNAAQQDHAAFRAHRSRQRCCIAFKRRSITGV